MHNDEELDIEMDEKIEVPTQTVGMKANHIFFPTIVQSMQKQYNPQIKKVR